MEAPEPPLENKVQWNDDGTIQATRYLTVSTAGVDGNAWLKFKEHQRIGQTFTCADPTLVAVQFGLDDQDGGYRGLTDRLGKAAPDLTVRLRRGGPEGPIVRQRTYPGGQTPADLLLRVDLKNEPGEVWYVEAETEHQDFEATKDFTLHAVARDRYPDGQLFLDGQPVEGDLHLRITGGRELADQRPTDFVFWAAYPEARVWIDPDRTVELMLADTLDQPLELAAARNEWVSTQLTVTPAPGHRVERAELSVGPLTGPEGATIEGENVDIHWLRYSHEIHHNGGLDSGRWYPDPLAPTPIATLSEAPDDRRTNVTFWVDLKAPASTPPGVYEGVARVRVNGEHELERPIRLVVRDFAIPHETFTHTALFKIRGGSVPRHRALTEDLARYRIANGASMSDFTHGVLRRQNFNEAAYQQTLGPEMQQSLIATGEVLEAHGLPSLRINPWADTYRYHQTGDPAARDGIIRFWQTYYPILEERGWVDMTYTRMVDEIGGEEMGRAQVLAELFRDYAPGVKIMVTAMQTPDVDELSQAIGIADIWTPSSRYGDKSIDFFLERLDAGEQVWPYIHDFLFHKSDVAGGRLFFWMLHKYGFQGATLWNIAPRGEFEHTWFGVVRRDQVWPGDGTLYYPGTEDAHFEQLWRSARFARIRDGIEDRECLLLLDRLAEQARAAGVLTPELAEQVETAKRGPERLTYGLGNFTHEPGAVQDARGQMDQVIEQLVAVVPAVEGANP